MRWKFEDVKSNGITQVRRAWKAQGSKEAGGRHSTYYKRETKHCKAMKIAPHRKRRRAALAPSTVYVHRHKALLLALCTSTATKHRALCTSTATKHRALCTSTATKHYYCVRPPPKSTEHCVRPPPQSISLGCATVLGMGANATRRSTRRKQLEEALYWGWEQKKLEEALEESN